MTDWLTANVQTAYPFEDTDAYDDALTPIADANVALITQVPAFLRAFDTAGTSLIIVDDTGATLIDSADGTYAVTVFGSFDIIKVRDDVTRNACEIVIPTGTVINVAGLDVPFVDTVLDYKAATLYSLNGLDEPTTLKLGEDFSVRDEGDTLYIDLADPDERSVLPATPYVFTISSIVPTADGAFWIQQQDGTCQRVDPQSVAHLIQLSNICKACCQCQDYYSSYVQMQGVDDGVAVAIDRAAQLMTAYHELVARWTRFLDAPNVPTPVNTPTSAREWVGNANPGKALNVTFRFIEGTYGGTLALTVTNSLDNIDITSLSVVVTAQVGKTFNKKPGVLQKATTKDQEDFDGFPGSYNFGALPAFESMMAANAIFNNEYVGETIIINLELTATQEVGGDLTSDLTLEIPINGGMTLTNPTETP